MSTTVIKTPLGRSAYRIAERRALALDAVENATNATEAQHWRTVASTFETALKILEDEAERGSEGV